MNYTCPKCKKTLKRVGGHGVNCGRNPADRFWPKVQKGPGCWIWKACRSSVTKYGTFCLNGHNINAHRAAWILTHGPIEGKGIDVLHTCHNGHLGCVRPDHLYLGTDKENTRDRLRAGSINSKLTADQVREIRAACDGVVGRKAISALYRNLSEKYGVGDKTIWSIKTGRKWKHLLPENANVPA